MGQEEKQNKSQSDMTLPEQRESSLTMSSPKVSADEMLRLHEHYSQKSSLSIWTLKNRTIRKAPFNFEGHWYLFKIYNEQHPDVVVRKSAQCGVSEWLINNAFWLADVFGMNSTYILPTDEILGAFIHGRVDPAINESAHLKEAMGKTDNVGLKAVNKGFIYFRAFYQTNPKEHKLKTIDADCVLYDEMDELGENARALGRKRLGHSKLKWQRAVSTPTYPDIKTDKLYNESDQMVWMIKCEHCGERQELDFFKNLFWKEEGEKITNVKVCCSKCKKPINRLAMGEWVAKYPGREIRGYHINKLMCERTSLVELIKESKKTLEHEIKEFYNSDLGLAYAPKGARIGKNDLLLCRDQKFEMIMRSDIKNCVMGIDIGKRHNFWIMKDDILLYTGEMDDLLHEGSRYMQVFNVDICVVDANPEYHLVRQFSDMHPGKIWLAYYSGGDDKKKVLFEPKEAEDGEDKPNTVLINRTGMGDVLVQKEIKERKLRLPRDIEKVPNWIAMMVAPTRIVDKDSNGNFVARWEEFGKPDHYFHAGIYCLVARFIQAQYQTIFYPNSVRGKERDTSGERNYDSDTLATTRKEQHTQAAETAKKKSAPTEIRSVDTGTKHGDWN